MKGKRGQAATIAVVLLLVIVIILVVASIVVILIYPNIISQQPNPIVIKTIQANPQETFVCNYPYIRLGNTCCLDNNHNGICDIDESQQKYNSNSCYHPYIQEGTSCCLDENDNRICDYEDYDHHTHNRHSQSYGSSYLDFPFEINDLEVRSSEIWIRISNIGDYDYIIKSIDIEGCDKENPSTMIYEGDDKQFTIDCPNDISSRDVTIEYQRSSSHSTSTSHGLIRE